MARWWCVDSADPGSLQRIVAAALIGLLALAAFDPALAERSEIGRASWFAGMLLAGLALVSSLRRPRRRDGATGTALIIDPSAALYRPGADPATLEPIDTAGLGAWRLGPWQFLHVRGQRDGPRFLAFDRRCIDPQGWAALQRALVRARRRSGRSAVPPPGDAASPRPPDPGGPTLKR